jgi:hypothetical protein
MYKKEKTLVEELFILFHLHHYVSINASEGVKQIAGDIDKIMVDLVKKHSSKTPEKLRNRVIRLIQDSNIVEMLKIKSIDNRFLLFIQELVQRITDGGYIFPIDFIIYVQRFFDKDSLRKDLSEEDFIKFQEEAKNNSQFIYNKLLNLGYFECKVS